MKKQIDIPVGRGRDAGYPDPPPGPHLDLGGAFLGLLAGADRLGIVAQGFGAIPYVPAVYVLQHIRRPRV